MLSGSPRVAASSTMALASRCGETWSAEAASRRTSEGVHPGATSTSVPRGRPVVTVPVLSSTSVAARPRFSSAPPSLITTPRRDARDSPDAIATGAANSNGQGRRNHQDGHGTLNRSTDQPGECGHSQG
jgi:hypothetical protein